MKAYDLQAIVSSLRELKITENTTDEEADAAMNMLTEFNQTELGVVRFSGQTPWERHSSGQELLHVLEGQVEVTLLPDGEPVQLTLPSGSVFIVPPGVWHRQFSVEGVTALFATPKPTDVSFAADPRRES